MFLTVGVRTEYRHRYIYRILIGCDGNHSLHKKTKREDPNDVSLAVDQGYFVSHQKMSVYLEKSYEHEDTVSTQASRMYPRSHDSHSCKHVVVSKF